MLARTSSHCSSTTSALEYSMWSIEASLEQHQAPRISHFSSQSQHFASHYVLLWAFKRPPASLFSPSLYTALQWKLHSLTVTFKHQKMLLTKVQIQNPFSSGKMTSCPDSTVSNASSLWMQPDQHGHTCEQSALLMDHEVAK